MSYRITKKELGSIVDNLNESLGLPVSINGARAGVGAYFVTSAGGAHRLSKMMTTGGGCKHITHNGTASETYELIRAFQAGALSMRQG